ncbi:pectinacetylesterase family protein [Striga asiatica]|uniref:Pectin acetylesterase n=1 Tax=Striga asiatica TaxID=4170 RepID=A0A5A7QE83_STRAF|nr:pectinacetylesterase family protein [Striga asiatica]
MSANQYRPARLAAGGTISWPWRRKLSNRKRTIAAAAAAGISLFLLIFSPISVSRKAAPNANADANSVVDSEWIPFTPLSKAKENSAFCLDGSVPGYHVRRGFGSGSDNWLLHVEVSPSLGGGWCSTLSSCYARERTKLGSSTYMEYQVQFLGILSHDPLQNPDFFNWNKVKIRYCDGSSFSSHPDSEYKNGTKIFFRGQLIWDTLMEELLSIGMSKAHEALLTGCSAGGLATLIHCDSFRDLLPKDANVKCLADAGFFINEYVLYFLGFSDTLFFSIHLHDHIPPDFPHILRQDIAGNRTIESFYHDVVHLQSVAKSLNHDCVARSEPSKIANILVPDSSDPNGSWLRCKLNIFNCDPKQLEVLHGYRKSLLKTINEIRQTLKVGVFINSCFAHCQTWAAETWHSPTSPRINNRTVAETVGYWYFNRGAAELVDCPFPCNPTCYHRDLTIR